MGERSKYGPGTFCWINLSTPDPDGARRFYGELFGWDYDDRASGFLMARRYGANVAAIYEREEQERAQGLPPHWNNYVTVSDTDAAADRARDLGWFGIRRAFRRDRCRAHGCAYRSDRRDVIGMAAAKAHRRRQRHRRGGS